MEVAILGPLEISDAAAAVVRLDASKERAVLEALAVAPGEVVSTDVLVEALWGADPPPSALKSLRSHVSRLRRALPTGAIATVTTGYRLRIPAESIDVHRFERLVAAGRQALGIDPHRAAALLEEGLALWRGTPVPDLADGTFRTGQVARLVELRSAAAELRMDAHLALGHHEEMLGELETLVAEEPLRERRWAQLMLALHRAGRDADARSAYRRLRRVLGEELGLEPSREVSELEALILRDDPTLALPPTRPPCTVPSPLTSFVGREELVRELRKLLHDHRLVTLVGPGGVGKSRLAMEAAHQETGAWPDGVWWVDLARIDEMGAVAAQLVRALGVEVAPGLGASEALRWFLGLRRLLLVLDNAEIVAGELGAWLAELLQGGSAVTALVTSRVPLAVPGERRVVVPPLEVPAPAETEPRGTEAVRLFLDRLDDQAAVVTGRDDIEAIAGLCRLVDGVPLGVELVARRVGFRPAPEVLTDLRDRSRLLAEERVGHDPRHASLEVVLASTVSLLAPEARAALARLSVFPGTFDLDAARAVLDPEAMTGFDELGSSGLVVPVEPAPDERRYRLLDTTRAYAATLLGTAEAAAGARRHAEHYRALARVAGRAMETSDEGRWLERLRREDRNLRTALDWWRGHEPAGALAFANALGRAWYAWGDLDQLAQLLAQLLADAAGDPGHDVAEEAWAHLRLGWPRFLTGDVAAGLDEMRRAAELFSQTHDARGLSLALGGRAHMTLLTTGDTDAALDLYRDAIEVSRAADPGTPTAWRIVEAAQALILADRIDDEVDVMLAEAEAVFAAADDHLGLSHLCMDRMLEAYARDDLDALEAAADRGIAHCRAAGNRFYEQILLVGKGAVRLHRDEAAQAAGFIAEAIHLAHDTHNLLQLGIALQAAAVQAAAVSEWVRAARLWGAGGALAPQWPLFQRRYGELIADAQTALGPAFAEELARGATLPLPEVLALAPVR